MQILLLDQILHTSWKKRLLVLALLALISFYVSYTFNSCLMKNFSQVTSPNNERQTVRERRQRRLPNALIIGVKKCGTRALLEFLKLHPYIRTANSEIHFFDRFYHKGLDWYRKRMPPSFEHQVVMEKTPAYWISREAPSRVAKMNKSVRLLVVVRNPVIRAVSAYVQTLSKRATMASFEQLVFLNSTNTGKVNSGIIDTRWGPIRLGVYSHYLPKWLRYFPLSQMLFIDGERLIIDPAHEIGRAQDFLNVPKLITSKNFYFNSTKGFPCILRNVSENDWSNLTDVEDRVMAKVPKCLGRTKGRAHPVVDIEVLRRLSDFFRPFNQYFYQMIGIDFGW